MRYQFSVRKYSTDCTSLGQNISFVTTPCTYVDKKKTVNFDKQKFGKFGYSFSCRIITLKNFIVRCCFIESIIDIWVCAFTKHYSFLLLTFSVRSKKKT